ncbi:alcohol dehydrogenase catalytic domain-containing protein [Clostridia bacterium]|nr:alcohol dehydrogenase catalytic domain-containing protein [Clostridia bacterium]
MKIALLEGKEKVVVRDVEMPEPASGEVRIKVAFAGLCGTDIEAYKGNAPKGWVITYPFRMGHELSGVVDKVGPDVTDLKVGDRVVPDGRLPCGICSMCRSGHVNACTNGGYTSGGFMEYSVYPRKCLVTVPDGLPMDHAALAEPLSCCLYGDKKLDVSVGDFAVVIGEGAIGIMHAKLLQLRGAKVAIVGLMKERLDIAKNMGIDYTIDAGKVDAVETVMELTGGKGANQIVIAAGAAPVFGQALEMAARYGQVLYFAANMKDSISLESDYIHYKELSVIGSYDSTTWHFEQALKVLAEGMIDGDALISHKFALEDISEAFLTAVKRDGLKIMIKNEE